MKFDLNDVLIQPTTLSTINSRKKVNPFDENGFLPLFTAPMNTVVDETNYQKFLENKIRVTLPRTLIIDNTPKVLSSENVFLSVGLTQFENIFLRKNVSGDLVTTYVLIDVANGHMLDILNLATKAKEKYGDKLVLMAGNIASPETYNEYGHAMINNQPVIDYVRVGVGNGNGCLTTEQTGVGYPMGSLISECYQYKKAQNHKTKIVADGGMKKYADPIKAIALGADYVMLGSLLNKALESAAPCYVEKSTLLLHDDAKTVYDAGYVLYKEFYGMSTKKAQKLLGNTVLKTSEGVEREVKVEYTLGQFIENFESYLRSAMSYTGASTLDEFRGKVKWNLITENAYKRYNK